jgi:uncharacterized protein YjiS (DUF1127 family)
MRPKFKSIDFAISPRVPSDESTVGYAELASFVQLRWMAAWHVIRKWGRRWQSRRELRSLSQREIADFCPKLTDAVNEAEKPFWRE